MSSVPPKARFFLRFLAALMSAALLSYLVWRVGPTKLWDNVLKLGWGFTLIIALSGVSHCLKTWAWRLTLGNDKAKMLFLHLLGLRLGAEAAGQLGILGQTLGDSMRVSRLSSEIPIANGLASVSLDRGLYFVTGTMVAIVGILAALFTVSVPHDLRLYAGLFVIALVAFLLVALLAMRKRWPVLSASARILGRVSSFKGWMEKRYLVIQSVEDRLFDFHHKTPNAFWASFSLNVGSQCLAILEVCLILWLMGVKIGFLSALSMEALTKLLNLVGNFNPGNFGTYEGGTMLIGTIFGLSSATGLALGLARRLRGFFWAAVGLVCFFVLTKPKKRDDFVDPGSTSTIVADPESSFPPSREAAVAILVPDTERNNDQVRCSLSCVGSLPILLRTILGAQKAGFRRIMVVVDPGARRRVERGLRAMKHLPESVEWIETTAGISLLKQLDFICTYVGSERLILVDGSTTYHPSLLRNASEWSEDAAPVLTSGDKPVGICALSGETIRHLANDRSTQAATLLDLYASLIAMDPVVSTPVAEDLWQRVITSEDLSVAEEKLNRWLVKPTDGIFARTNRRISIPISRQLIKFPITANMVSIFTLGVGFASAAFFAFGGYWHTLIGAFLCLWASILDGCDGEVARLKLQESAFGCWLETVCDYLFYLFLFAGMTLGLWRSSGNRAYPMWGGVLLFGAIASFLASAWGRHRLAGQRPEQLLGILHARLESRRSNPFFFLGRHTEFIIRRCFFPYALLFFALFKIMSVAFVLSAIAANLVWPIALYSSRTFAGAANSRTLHPVRIQPDRDPTYSAAS
jgi:phosphatidylglycerophosphate synthase